MHWDAVLVSIGVLQHEAGRQAVPREMDQVPALPLLQGCLQLVTRHPVLQDAQLDRFTLSLGDALDQALEGVALLTQAED
jgi:hypothetical protein